MDTFSRWKPGAMFLETLWAKCGGGWTLPSGVRLQEPPGHGRGLRPHLSEAAHTLQRECPLRALPEAFSRAQTRRRAS